MTDTTQPTDDTGDDSTLGQRLDAKVAELRQAIEDTIGEVGDQITNLLNDLQILASEASAAIGRREQDRRAEGSKLGE